MTERRHGQSQPVYEHGLDFSSEGGGDSGLLLSQEVTTNTSVLKVSLWLLCRALMKLGDHHPSKRNRLGLGCRVAEQC